MKRTLGAIALAFAACAQAGPMDLVRSESATLNLTLDRCSIMVRTLYVKLRASIPRDKEDDVSMCVADGKAALKAGFEKIKPAVAPKAAAALADWRLEWMSAFDAALPQDGEIERSYLQRQVNSKQAISRAANRLEMAAE